MTSLLFWLTVGVLFSLYRALLNPDEAQPVIWYKHSSYLITLHLVWGALTIPYLKALQKVYYEKGLVRAILLTAAVGLVHSLATVLLYFIVAYVIPFATTFDVKKYVAGVEINIVSSFFISWLTAVVIFIVWFGWSGLQEKERQAKLNAELQAQLVQTQLQMLRMQLNPHFIFNTFNTISMLVRANKNEEATDMLAKLAELLRVSLYKKETQLIPLQAELEYCRHYLDIEMVRFKDRLKVTFEVDPDSEKKLVPSMILQPLIENAFKHGLMNSLDAAPLLKIESKEEGEELCISIKNTGKLKPLNENGSSIGVHNVRERLKLHYGDKAHFTLEQQNGLVVASIKIAYEQV
ncbi:sensor histidine kinase [Pontibacter locisalis]|uniref:Sensor histidine kinase n=2 Tax=Pontibacter locisalis TaxID=1719035 RepID=A0ABW5IPR1_9BACT